MNSEEEIWKAIPGYGESYQISNLGRIKSASRYKINGWGGMTLLPEVIMRPKKTPQGYHQIGLRNPKQKLFYVHRLVAFSFVENPEGKPEVNHKDGNKDNNFAHNLEWVTPKENIVHSVAMGLKKPHGEKLSHEEAMEVYKSTEPDCVVSLKYGISIRSVRDIKKKKRWAFLHNENSV